jgi:hypothetical protein
MREKSKKKESAISRRLKVNGELSAATVIAGQVSEWLVFE